MITKVTWQRHEVQWTSGHVCLRPGGVYHGVTSVVRESYTPHSPHAVLSLRQRPLVVHSGFIIFIKKIILRISFASSD